MSHLETILGTCIVDTAEVAVEPGAWQNFCAAIGDGNPAYWDSDAAARVTGEVIAPPAMTTAWTRPHPWRPNRDAKAAARPLELHHRLKEHFGYPYGVVEDTELNIHGFLAAGDSVISEQKILEIADERPSRLGIGRSWTIEATYRDQKGRVVASERIRLFSYRK